MFEGQWAAEGGLSWQFMPVYTLLPDMKNLYMHTMHARTRWAAGQLLVSVQQYYVEHGEYPGALMDLKNAKNHAHSVDPFSGSSLLYKLVGEQFVIYSVGQDRDDDGGRALLDDDGNEVSYPDLIPLDKLETIRKCNPESIDGDWVLYSSDRE